MLAKCTMIEPFFCKEDESLVEVAKKLRAHTLRHIFVVDAAQYPIGIISTTDMNNRVVAEGKDPKALKAKDIMTKPIEVFDKKMDAALAYKEMRDKKRIMCAVVDQKKFVGMVTIGEVLHCVAGK